MTARSVLVKLAAVLFMALALAPHASAQDAVKARRMGVVWREGTPHLYYSARDLLRGEVVKKLESGLPQRIVVQHFAYAPRRKEPLAVAGQTCKIVFDLWQEAYRVEREVVGAMPSVHIVETREQVLELCLVFRDVPIGPPAPYTGRSHIYFASLLELNPLSTSTIARIRRWLSRPRGDYNMEGRSFFGSFVSLFVNDRIGSAERTLRLKSQDVELR
jgi:hypothetical protein